MVTRIIKKLKVVEHIVMIAIFAIFVVVVGKYSYKDLASYYAQYKEYLRQQKLERVQQAYVCPAGLITIKVEGGKVCRGEVADSVYKTIFDTYPAKSGGREQVYRFLSEGNIEDADSILKNIIPIDRYEPMALDKDFSWDEDPHNEPYWRFEFYGLRPVLNLFYAFDATHNLTYLEKARDMGLSFVTIGTNKKYAWDDYHAVSFRAMVLVKLWWQLRENNLLTYENNQMLLASIQQHGAFLADPNHYDKAYNHGLNQSAALYLLAANFPDFSESSEWKALSIQRLNEGLLNVIDRDGVLIENSPYYHLYSLEKYWEIYKYSNDFHVPINELFDDRIRKMVNYTVYMLQPDEEIPLAGASLKRRVFLSGVYKEMAAKFPELEYVLTQGKTGKKPSQLNTVYPDSGEIIMRSSWGTPQTYKDQTYLFFDAGPFRTEHSDMDALSFSLYSDGLSIMPDAGLYTYESSAYKDYFHGTRSHNTVTVDGLDQKKGTAIMGQFIQGDNYVSQSAEHELYKGVQHQRTITMLNKKYIFIVDKIHSADMHEYSQNFHLFSGAVIKNDGLSVKVWQQTPTSTREVANIFQLVPENTILQMVINQTSPLDGLCSVEYGKTIPCYALKYVQKSKDATYVTLIELGQHDSRLRYSVVNNQIHLEDSQSIFTAQIGETVSTEGRVVTKTNPTPVPRRIPMTSMNVDAWRIPEKEQSFGTTSNIGDFLRITNLEGNKSISATSTVNVDLSGSNIFLKMKVTNRPVIERLDLAFSTNGWKGYMVTSLKESYRDEYNGELLNITLGKGKERMGRGQWQEYGTGFDWSKIDQVRITLRTKANTTAAIQLLELSSTPMLKEGEVIIIFDDGYESILPAIKIMQQYGLKGNIAVIGDRVKNNERGYLSLKQLREIKDVYGWDLVNHSEHHVDAVTTYAKKRDIEGFENDLLSGAQFLEESGLNTAPNWYVYPHGATNAALKEVVGKYYTFARTTINQPETYPFGDPLTVKTISADGVESTGENVFIPINVIMGAVRDAKTFKLPLFITFHRIHGTVSDRPGYELENFRQLISQIAAQHIPVKTLRQFDADHGITEYPMSFTAPQPAQITLTIDSRKVVWWKRIKYVFHDMWIHIVTSVRTLYKKL